MKRSSLVFAVLALALAPSVGAQEKQANVEKAWKCQVTTEGAQLVWSKYDGGDWANIHITPFNRPGSYKVVKEGETAKGKTSNGTEFVCKLA